MLIMSGIIFVRDKNRTFTYAFENTSSEIVLDKESGRILYENNADQKRGIASTTKILTAITVIENCDVQEIITIDDEAVGVEGSSIYLKHGDRFKVIDLLYGLMLRSGNDSAVALSKHVAGSIEAFSSLMNDTAKKAGAINSNFSNPHGLSDENHYSTARDLALITAYALKNQTFSKISATKSYTFTKEDGTKQTFINKNKMLKNYQGADGVKTGYTKKDGRCLVSSATRDGVQLICVVLNCAPMFERSSELLDRCFNDYKNRTIFKKDEAIGCVVLKDKLTDKNVAVEFMVDNDVSELLTQSQRENLDFKVKIDENSAYPLVFGAYIGEIEISDNFKLTKRYKIYIINVKEVEDFDNPNLRTGNYLIYENK